jgi:Flp pilus assembly protein TadD
MSLRLVLLGLALVLAAALASPAVEQRRQPLPSTDAGREYDRGTRARVAQDWKAATDAFRRAVALRPAFPEAWNELGFALRNQGRGWVRV